jgi:glycine/D-amino acid oxidase-like deaminating enzyme
MGWGASGRNGGIACIGSHKLTYGKMISTYGLEATRSFHRAMTESVELVADNARRHAIDIWQHGSGEVTLAHRPNRLQELRAEQAFLRSTFGEESELLSRADLQAQGLAGPTFHGGLRGKTGFGIHPLNYVRGLARAAHKAGVRLHPLSRLIRWEETGSEHHLYTEQGRLTANRVLVCSNGYTPEQVSTRHAGRLLPALSSIIVTRPLSEDELKAQGWTSSTMAYDSRNLLHYFRLLPNRRFLFGGRGGTDTTAAGGTHYRDTITCAFNRHFPAWRDVEITHYWRGLVCLAYDRVPYVARWMTGKSTKEELPAVITRRLARFPLPAFRPLYLKGAYLWYGIEDAR